MHLVGLISQFWTYMSFLHKIYFTWIHRETSQYTAHSFTYFIEFQYARLAVILISLLSVLELLKVFKVWHWQSLLLHCGIFWFLIFFPIRIFPDYTQKGKDFSQLVTTNFILFEIYFCRIFYLVALTFMNT